jgi:predicted nucleic-acid-binding protein
MELRLTEDEPGFVSVVTMVETVWALGSIYELSDHEIASAVERMLQADTLVIQNEQEVFTAAVALKAGHGSFTDALIGALGTWAGCASTLTFDRKALRLGTFEPSIVSAIVFRPSVHAVFGQLLGDGTPQSGYRLRSQFDVSPEDASLDSPPSAKWEEIF